MSQGRPRGEATRTPSSLPAFCINRCFFTSCVSKTRGTLPEHFQNTCEGAAPLHAYAYAERHAGCYRSHRLDHDLGRKNWCCSSCAASPCCCVPHAAAPFTHPPASNAVSGRIWNDVEGKVGGARGARFLRMQREGRQSKWCDLSGTMHRGRRSVHMNPGAEFGGSCDDRGRRLISVPMQPQCG